LPGVCHADCADPGGWPGDAFLSELPAVGEEFYIFWNSLYHPDSRFQKIVHSPLAQAIETMRPAERSVNCYMEGASDVPAAGKIPASPKNSRTRQEPTANEAAPTRRNRPESLQQARWERPPPAIAWEASDQCRTPKRHSAWSGVSCLWDGVSCFADGSRRIVLPPAFKRCRICEHAAAIFPQGMA